MTAILAYSGALAEEGVPLSPVLTRIQPDCQLIGANWRDEYGIRIDDLSNLRDLPSNELRTAETLAKQLQPLGIVAVADYSCAKQDAPLDIVTVRVFTFEDPRLASDWWQKKYQYYGWEKHYTKPAGSKYPTVDSTELAKRAMLEGNLWITSHHIRTGTEHLILLENVLDLLGE